MLIGQYYPTHRSMRTVSYTHLHLPEGSVLANTCTVSPIVLYYVLELEIKRKRKDIGICSMHPAAVPGTPHHGHYVLGAHTTNNLDLATPEQIKKCVDLVEGTKKEAYVVPADVSSTVADMGSLVTAVTLSGVLDYYQVGTKVIKVPEEMVEKQILMTLQTMEMCIRDRLFENRKLCIKVIQIKYSKS